MYVIKRERVYPIGKSYKEHKRGDSILFSLRSASKSKRDNIRK